MTDKLMESLRQAYMKETGQTGAQCPMSDQAAAFASGELDPESAEKVQAHIHTCKQCLDLVMDIRMAESEAESLKGERVEVLPGLQKAIDKGKKPKESPLSRILDAIRDFFYRGTRFRPIPAFATIAVVVLAGILLLRAPSPDTPYAIDILMHGRSQIGLRGGQPEYRDFQLKPGESIQSGDLFRFRAKVDKPAFIYVIFIDSAGKIESMEKGLVQGGQEISIPEGDEWFKLDTHTGTERLFMLASTAKIGDFAKKIEELKPTGIEKIEKVFPKASVQSFGFLHR